MPGLTIRWPDPLWLDLCIRKLALRTCLLTERRKHAVGSKWEERHAHSCGIGDSVGNRGSGRDHGRFAESDDSTLVIAFPSHHVDHEVGDVVQARQTVELHVGIQHTAGGLVHYFFFEQRIADAHHHGAVTTALGHFQIDDEAAILHGDHLFDLHHAGLGVHFDFGHTYAAYTAVGEIRRLGLVGILAANCERHRAQLGAGLLPA